jgi:hypothetical protein
MLQELLKQVVGTLGALTLNDRAQRVHPFAGFLAIGIWRGNAYSVLGYH